MTIKEFKQKFLIALFSRDEWTRKVSDVQYQTRCPYCGDTQRNFNTGHFYVRCDVNDNYPIVYNCFKCPAQGVLTRETLEMLGISDSLMSSSIDSVMKKCTDIKTMGYQKETSFKVFPFQLPQLTHRIQKIKYLENRLGIHVTESIAKETKMVTSLKDFLDYNQINYLSCNPYIAKQLEEKYIGFLSYGNSHILFRDVTETEKYSWVKYPIVPSSAQNMTAYSIEGSVDLFTQDIIHINLCEGVFDAISICYNLGYHIDNCVNMCVCGKNYNRMIRHLVTRGLFGYNVVLNIFSDNDKDFNPKKENYDTTIDYYKKALSMYTILFKEINVYYNRLYKDCGISRENIELKKYRI